MTKQRINLIFYGIMIILYLFTLTSWGRSTHLLDHRQASPSQVNAVSLTTIIKHTQAFRSILFQESYTH